MSVVLPAPLGPSKPTSCPRFAGETHAIERGLFASGIAVGEIKNLQHGRAAKFEQDAF